MIAVAGAGKTTVLEQRSRYLKSKGVDNQLIITFTKKAANNIVKKLESVSDSMFIGTFHSFCFKLLKEFSEDKLPNKFITERDEFKLFIYASQIIKKAHARVTAKEVIEHMNKLFSSGQAPYTWKSLRGRTALNRLAFSIYQKVSSDGYGFFEELLIEARELLDKSKDVQKILQTRYPVIMVDEFQDTDDVQADVLKLLLGPESSLFVVGDSAQSIYTWRGCNPKILDNFDKVFGNSEEIILDTNFRSHDEILTTANIVLENMDISRRMIGVKGRKKDAIRVVKYDNPSVEAKAIAAEIEGKTHKDIAILYRSNAQAGFIESELSSRKIPFSVSGTSRSFFDYPEIKPLVSYMMLALDLTDVDSLRYIWNRPNRFLKSDWVTDSAAKKESLNAIEILKEVGTKRMNVNQRNSLRILSKALMHLQKIGDGTPIDIIRYVFSTLNYKRYLAELAERSLSREFSDIEESTKQFGKIAQEFASVRALLSHIEFTKSLQKEANERGDGVTLSTIHSAKGLEFPKVYLIGAEEGILPHEKAYSIEEEHRLMYVGITRAENELDVSFYDIPSRFLKKVIKEHPVHEFDTSSV